jgi:probable rRNA maturation factor
MLTLDLQITNEGRYPVNGERLFGAIEAVLRQQPDGRVFDKVTVSLLFVDKELMAEYNWQYHQTQGPTDVLSFPYTDPESQVGDEPFVLPPELGVILGDLIVCYPVAEEIAQKEGKTVDEVVEFYVLHGLEHLLGHHHE